jgi:lipopolysaccharide transport system permease protein
MRRQNAVKSGTSFQPARELSWRERAGGLNAGNVVDAARSVRNPRMKLPPEHHYSSESIWRRPGRFARDLQRDVRQCPELAWQLFMRDLRANYRQSLLGYVWAFLPPLAWAAMFLLLRAQGVTTAAPTAVDYSVHVLTGMVFWQVFFDALQMPARVFAQAKPLLTKINFPREALVVAGLLDVGFQFLLRLPLLLWPFFTGQLSWHGGVWLAPLGVAILALAGVCLGVLLLPLALLYQDVGRALALVGSFWLLITPVAYAVPAHGWGQSLARWNPVSPLLVTTRDWWTGQPTGMVAEFAAISVAVLVLLGAGWLAMRVSLPHLISRMGA